MMKSVMIRLRAASNEKTKSVMIRLRAASNEKTKSAMRRYATKIRTTNVQRWSANGSRDALTLRRSRRAYHGLL
jgi:hypothetical protein